MAVPPSSQRPSTRQRNLRWAWRRFLVCSFRLLYNELAWTYDAVSWFVSLGRWRQWQQTILPHLPPSGRVLEVGFGPGHLLRDLASAGYGVVGLELSPAMLRLAGRRLRRQQLDIALCRADAGALPFTGSAFDAIVLTFPTPYVYDRVWLAQLPRVLKTGGTLIVVEMASFNGNHPIERGLESLYRVTGQRGPAPALPDLLEEAGLKAWRQRVAVDGSTVDLVIAEMPPGK
jgi:ubiquinone/menaquinone biosynthesis C-methylase UbiE